MRVVLSIHDPPIWSLPAAEVARIQAALPDVEVVDARTAPARRRALPEADALLATRLSASEFALARKLRWVHTTAVGVGGLLSPALVRSRVQVTNSRGVHSEAIAEHAIALALALRRSLPLAAVRQQDRRWAQEELYGREVAPLSRSQLLVVGLGAIGSRVAAMGWSLGMRVMGIRRRATAGAPRGVSEVLPPRRLHAALERADIVVLAAPSTSDTKTLIGAPELARMRRHAILVNVSRGSLVDERALLRTLRQGRIGGAGLDAFQREPLRRSSPLWRAPNLLITPHSASFDGDYWGPAIDLFLDNVDRFRSGEPLHNVVDKRRRY